MKYGFMRGAAWASCILMAGLNTHCATVKAPKHAMKRPAAVQKTAQISKQKKTAKPAVLAEADEDFTLSAEGDDSFAEAGRGERFSSSGF